MDPVTVSILVAILAAASSVLVPLISLAGPPILEEVQHLLAPPAAPGVPVGPDGKPLPIDPQTGRPIVPGSNPVEFFDRSGPDFMTHVAMAVGAVALTGIGIWLTFRKRG